MHIACEPSSARQPTGDSSVATSFRDICLSQRGVLWAAELCRWASSFDVSNYRIAFLEDEGNMILRNICFYLTSDTAYRPTADIFNAIFIKYTYITFLPTPWSRVLLLKLTGFQLVQKFTAFYGTRRFITAFTSARHLSLS